MENEREDWFSDGWSEDGGVVADGRDSEELPEETADGGESAEAEKSSGDPAATETDAATEGELLRFVLEYPEVEAEDIPRSVWERVARGESLVAAWGKYEAEALRRENRRLRERDSQRELNRRRSAGSQRGVGASDAVYDAFDRGWDSAW